MAVLTRGDIFGEAVIAGASYPFAAEAAEPSRLMSKPGAVLRPLARDNDEIMAQIMRIMSRELKNLQMENVAAVGCILLKMSSGMLGKGGTFAFPYDKSRGVAAHHETRNLLSCARPAQRRGRVRQRTGSNDRKLCRARRIMLRRLLCDAGRVPRLAFVVRQ